MSTVHFVLSTCTCDDSGPAITIKITVTRAIVGERCPVSSTGYRTAPLCSDHPGSQDMLKEGKSAVSDSDSHWFAVDCEKK